MSATQSISAISGGASRTATTPSANPDHRRVARNAVRLSRLWHPKASFSPTFQLSLADLRSAKNRLQDWPGYWNPATSEEQQVEYLLSTGWKAKSCGVSTQEGR